MVPEPLDREDSGMLWSALVGSTDNEGEIAVKPCVKPDVLYRRICTTMRYSLRYIEKSLKFQKSKESRQR